MGRVQWPIATCAVVLALWAGGSGPVAHADTGDADAGANSSDAGSDGSAGTDAAGDSDDDRAARAASTLSSSTTTSDPGTTNDPDSGDGPTERTDSQASPADGHDEQPVDKESGREECERTLERAPAAQFLPEAPALEIAPLPEEMPPPALAPAPPPLDLPPASPELPADPEPVDVTMAGGGAASGYSPPVLTVPIIVAPLTAGPPPLLGAAAAPRLTAQSVPTGLGGTVGAATPARLRAMQGGMLFNGWAPTRLPSAEAAGSRGTLRASRVSETARGAMPGVAGLVAITAVGVCLGYRQAAAAQQLQYRGADRFM